MDGHLFSYHFSRMEDPAGFLLQKAYLVSLLRKQQSRSPGCHCCASNSPGLQGVIPAQAAVQTFQAFDKTGLLLACRDGQWCHSAEVLPLFINHPRQGMPKQRIADWAARGNARLFVFPCFFFFQFQGDGVKIDIMLHAIFIRSHRITFLRDGAGD